MSWPVAFFILLGVAATTAALTLTDTYTKLDPHALCGEIAAMSPDEFRVWFGPQPGPWDRRTGPAVLACILKEARRVDR